MAQTRDDQAALAQREWIRRRIALVNHLKHNHYPPMDYFTETAQAALDIVNSPSYRFEPGQQGADNRVKLPEGVTVNGQDSMDAWEIIDWLHLNDPVFIEDPDAFDEDDDESDD